MAAPMPTGERVCPAGAGGYALMALLLWVALSGLALAAAAQVWSTSSRRDKEAQLVHIGGEFRAAIRSYAASSPGAEQYPTRLEDLVLDPRFPFVKRHLRRIYADPLTGTPEWGVVKVGEGIIGVHSLAQGKPLKRVLDPELGIADDAPSYGDWVFAYRPGEAGGGTVDDHQETSPGGNPPAREPGGLPLHDG